jgi:hypothetical protein
VNPPTVVVKKPNPRNVQNTDKIKELEEQIQKYGPKPETRYERLEDIRLTGFYVTDSKRRDML